MTVKGTLIALLKAAKDDVKVTPPIVGPLKKMLNDAGYENDFHIRNLVRQVSGDEQLDITKISVKQAKSLAKFAEFLSEHLDQKDYAKEVLALAWVNECAWSEACVLYALSQETQKPVDLDTLIKEFNPKMALTDITPTLHGFGWPIPIPERQLKDYLAACKKAGCNLFDETATAVAKAVAVQWSGK